MWKKVIGGKSLREGVLKAEGTGGREVERWHGSEVCTPEELRSVHTCSTLQESLQFLVVPRTVGLSKADLLPCSITARYRASVLTN